MKQVFTAIALLALVGCTTNGSAFKPPEYYLSYGYVQDTVALNNQGFELIQAGDTRAARTTFQKATDILTSGAQAHQDLLNAPERRTEQSAPAAQIADAFTDIERSEWRVPILSTHPIARATVSVRLKKGTCTGFFIAPNVVMTAAHCVSKDSLPTVVISTLDSPEDLLEGNGQRVTVQAAALPDGARDAPPCDDDDFAFLKVNYRSPYVISVSDSYVQAGDPLINLGYSGDLNDGYFLQADFGCRVALSGAFGGFRSNCEGYRGNSGGPTLRINAGSETFHAVGVHVCSRSRDGGKRTDGLRGTGHVSVARAMDWYRDNVTW